MLRKARFAFARPAWMVPLCLVLTLFFLSEGGRLLSAQSAPASRTFSDVELYRGIFLADGPVADAIPEIRDELKFTNVISDPEVIAAIRGLHGRIIETIQKNNPSFFAAFGEAMRSGNHLQVDRALEMAAAVTTDAVTNLPEIAKLREDLKADPTLRETLVAELQKTDGAEQATREDLEQALDLLVADSLNQETSRDPRLLSASIVALIVAVAAVVAAITIVAAQSYGVVFNVAAAVNVAVAVVAWKWFFTPKRKSVAEANLLREQVVDSVVKTFGVGTPATGTPTLQS